MGSVRHHYGTPRHLGIMVGNRLCWSKMQHQQMNPRTGCGTDQAAAYTKPETGEQSLLAKCLAPASKHEIRIWEGAWWGILNSPVELYISRWGPHDLEQAR